MKTTALKTGSMYARSLLALSAVLATNAMGQEPRQLEEVVVTAEHREMNLQDTPISITAFTADTIRALGISNGLDLFGHVPNMNVQQYQGGRSGLSYAIRGIVDAETLITFDPAVSVYIDNVLLAKNVGGILDVIDLERIEVLRGPQGTLYGRNTMGGAVNYISKKPVDEFEGSVKGTAGNYDTWNLRGMVNVPLLGADSSAGELNMRVAAATLNRDDGIQDNNYKSPPGQPKVPSELGTVDRNVGLLQLQWKPRDDLSVLYAYDVTRINEIPPVPWDTIAGTNAAGPFVAPFLEPNESDYPKSGFWDAPVNIAHTSVDGQGLTVSWDLSDNLTLQSITGYRRMENRGQSGTDGSPLPLLVTLDVQRFHSLSQEFRLLGSAMDSQLEYSTGVYYWDEDGDVYNTVSIFGSPGPSDTVAKYANKSWAAYGQATYHLTDKLDLTGGLRYTYEDRDMNKASLAGQSFPKPLWYDNYVNLPGINENTIFPKASKDFDNVSWLVSAAYNWTDDLMSYAKISTGFQSGGFNVRDESMESFTRGFDDETLTGYELGIKSQWAGRYMVNADVFFSDYSDKQVDIFNPETLGNAAQNADVEIYGAELEALAQLTDNWQLGLGYGYLDIEWTKFKDFEGNDLSDISSSAYAPDNTANGHVMYQHPLALGVFSARVDWSYRDKTLFTSEANSSDAFHMFNARIALDDIRAWRDTTVRVSLWGKNLTDEGYWTSGVDLLEFFGFAYNLWGEPRTYGVDLEVLF